MVVFWAADKYYFIIIKQIRVIGIKISNVYVILKYKIK